MIFWGGIFLRFITYFFDIFRSVKAIYNFPFTVTKIFDFGMNL